MLLPDKHIRLSESILGLGAFVLEHLDEPTTIDSLWHALQEANENESFPARHGIDNLVLAAVFLYSVGIVSDSADGTLVQCDS